MKLTSLRFKFSAVLVAMAAVLVATSGIVSVRLSYKALRQQKQQDELVIARNTAIQVKEVLVKARKAVDALAKMPSIQSMDPDRQVDALTIVTQTTELIDGIVITDAKGRIRAMDGEINTERVMPAENHYRSFAQRAAASRASFISDAYLSRTSEVCVSINAPILRDGKFVGLVSCGILLRDHTMGGIENIRIGETGYAYVVDSTGDVVLHPQREREFENFSTNPAVRALLEKRTAGVTEFVNADGLSVLAAYAPVDEIGWGVIVRQPTDESYALAEQIRVTLWVLLATSVALALGLGFFLANKILNPVSSLLDGARRIGKGDLSVTIEPRTNDEIGELARAFNRMASDLRDRLRQIDLAHQNVLEAHGRLARSERLASVGQMAAGLAHEINNPINIIMGFSELLLRRMDPADPLRAHAEEIDREINRCQRLVQNLLDLSRQRPIGDDTCRLDLVVSETASLLKEQARQKNISIDVRVADTPVRVRGDGDQLRQVILNVVLNAIQAMPEGGTVTVTLDAAGTTAVAAIADTGPGIPPDLRDRIFDPFFTTKETGTGLGLAVSHAIIERHGGRIEVDCPPEGGSVFRVILPQEEAALVRV